MTKNTLIEVLSVIIANNANTPQEARKIIDDYFNKYQPSGIKKSEIKRYFKL